MKFVVAFVSLLLVLFLFVIGVSFLFRPEVEDSLIEEPTLSEEQKTKVMNIGIDYVTENYDADYSVNGDVEWGHYKEGDIDYFYPVASFRVPADMQQSGQLVNVMVDPETEEIVKVVTLPSKSTPPNLPDEPPIPEPKEPLPNIEHPKKEEATLLWKINLEHFAWDITTSDEKVLTSNNEATYCFNLTNGEPLWNTSLPRNRGIEVYQDNVYTGSVGGIVNKLDMETGELIAQFPAPVSSSFGSKSPPEFWLADNKLFVKRDGIAVYDVNTEEQLIWAPVPFVDRQLGNSTLNAPESNYIFIYGNSRFNPNNGSFYWHLEGSHSPHLVIDQKQVIFWNYNPTNYDPGHFIINVNASNGDTLWNYDVGASVFQPTSINGLLLFGSTKGYFYALNITDGSLVWRTKVDTQNLLLNYDYDSAGGDNPLRASPVILDSQNQKAYWGFILTQFASFLDDDDPDESQGDLACLDINTGDIIWTEQFQSNSSVAQDALPDLVGLANLKNTLFFTANNHLWIFNKQTGNLTDDIIFDHYILPPVKTDDKVCIAADLFIFVYE